MKKRKWLITIIFIALVAILLSGSYVFFTTGGSNAAVKFIFSRYAPFSKMSFQSVSGSFAQGLVYQGVSLGGSIFLPEGSNLQIQKLNILINSFSLDGLEVGIHNGRLRVPNFDTLLLYGHLEEGRYDLNIYSKHLDLRELFDLIEERELKRITGLIGDFNLRLQGDFFQPQLSGNFKVDHLEREQFYLKNSPVNFSLQLKEVKDKPELTGTIFLEAGEATFGRSAIVYLEKSKIIFWDKPAEIYFDLKGASTVEEAKIKIELKGPRKNPQLSLSSNPALPEERLMLMLATNRSWRGSHTDLFKGEKIENITQEFLDYFIFSRPASKIALFLGVRGISLEYDDQSRGVGLRKDIDDATAIIYSIDQRQDDRLEDPLTQKIGIEHRIGDDIYFGLRKDISQVKDSGEEKAARKDDSEIILKFKREF